MTLNEVIYNIRNLIKEKNDDSKLSNRQIAFIVNYLRSTLIRRDYDKKKPLSFHLEQDLGTVDLETIDSAECSDIPSNCKIVRTVLELPKFVEASDRNLLTFVGEIGKIKGFTIVPWNRFQWWMNRKYTGNVKVVSARGNRIYILNGIGMKGINVRGVFEDPREAYKFKNCPTGECYTDDMEYPLSGWMVKAIQQMFFSEELNIYTILKKDTTNNSYSEDQNER